jgi:WD40 repeat protein
MAESLSQSAGRQRFYVWNAQGGAMLRRVPLHKRPKCLVLDRQNSQALCGLANGKIGIVELSGREKMREIGDGGKPVSAILVSADGKLLACGHEDGLIEIWTTETMKPLRKLDGHERSVIGLAFGPEGRTLASIGGDATLRIWDMTTWQQVRMTELAKPGTTGRERSLPTAVAISADERNVAIGTTSGQVISWRMEDGKESWRLQLNEDPVAVMSFSEGGDRLAVGTRSSLRICDAKTGRQVRLLESEGGSTTFRFLDGDTILASAGEQSFHRWDLKTGRDQLRQAGHASAVDYMAFAPDGKSLATVSAFDRTIRLWNVTTGKQTLLLEHPDKPVILCRSVAFTPDGRMLVSTDGSNHICFFDVTSRKIVRSLPCTNVNGKLEPYSVDASLALARNGKTLAVESCRLGSDGVIRLDIWDVDRSKQLRNYRLPVTGQGVIPNSGGRIAFSQDGSRVAFASSSSIVSVRDWVKDKVLASLPTFSEGAIEGIAYSPDGAWLAGCGGGWHRSGSLSSLDQVDNKIRIWDATTYKLQRSLAGHTWTVTSVAWMADSRTLISGSEDGTLRLWEASTGLELLRLQDQGNNIHCVAVSPDGKTVASGMSDGSALLWELAPLEGLIPVARPVSNLLLDKLLTDLAGEDGHALYRALWTLSAFPTVTTPFLKAELVARDRDPQERVRQSLMDLDAADFERREAASRKLARLGGLAEAALKKAVAQAPSNEVRARARALLQSLASRKFKDIEHQLDRRIVWVLERIGSPDARALLQELAKPGSSYSAADDARAALKRL